MRHTDEEPCLAWTIFISIASAHDIYEHRLLLPTRLKVTHSELLGRVCDRVQLQAWRTGGGWGGEGSSTTQFWRLAPLKFTNNALNKQKRDVYVPASSLPVVELYQLTQGLVCD